MNKPLDPFTKRKLEEFRENVRYDEAELGCNWSMEDLEEWIIDTIRECRKERDEEKKRILLELDKLQEYYNQRRNDPVYKLRNTVYVLAIGEAMDIVEGKTADQILNKNTY